MRKLWLTFSQTATIVLAIVFALGVFQPEWINWLTWLKSSNPTPPGIVTLTEAPPTKEFATATSSYREASKKALPSVVHIFTSQKTRVRRHPLLDDPMFRQFFGDRPGAEERRSSGLGSGVIVSASGYILTNFHVIDGADQIEIALNDGRSLSARVVGSDPDTDLAVLQAFQAAPKESEPLNLPAITLGQMTEVDIGDVVLAIGNPFGVGQTVTMGIVSALGRSHLGINTFENFIQTDAAINPGNSGGALISSAGNLIGINTAIYSRSGGSLGIGFAIPISTTKQVMEEIIQTGRVTRGWVGIEVQEITPELAESFGLPDQSGVLIAGVQRGSPAEMGGIQPGDTLLVVGEKAVKNTQAMLDLIAGEKPGSEVLFTVRRGKNNVQLTIRIGPRPPRPREAR